jgi:hypothetical protein
VVSCFAMISDIFTVVSDVRVCNTNFVDFST